jgi:hypothetical protein
MPTATADRERVAVDVVWRLGVCRATRAGFGWHAFLCAQIGSGKTYVVGVILEQISLGSDPARCRVWRAQHLSYWMTTMLHSFPGATPFDAARSASSAPRWVANRGRRTSPTLSGVQSRPFQSVRWTGDASAPAGRTPRLMLAGLYRRGRRQEKDLDASLPHPRHPHFQQVA